MRLVAAAAAVVATATAMTTATAKKKLLNMHACVEMQPLNVGETGCQNA